MAHLIERKSKLVGFYWNQTDEEAKVSPSFDNPPRG